MDVEYNVSGCSFAGISGFQYNWGTRAQTQLQRQIFEHQHGFELYG